MTVDTVNPTIPPVTTIHSVGTPPCADAIPPSMPTLMAMMLSGIMTSKAPKKGASKSSKAIFRIMPIPPPTAIAKNMFQPVGMIWLTAKAIMAPEQAPTSGSIILKFMRVRMYNDREIVNGFSSSEQTTLAASGRGIRQSLSFKSRNKLRGMKPTSGHPPDPLTRNHV